MRNTDSSLRRTTREAQPSTPCGQRWSRPIRLSALLFVALILAAACSARALDRYRGRKVNPTGDGVLATFDGPARAVQCACAIRDGVAALGIEIRAGVHTGEIELRGDDVSGVAVHLGARVAAFAGPSEVLVTRTVTDLVAGSGLHFTGRGEHELKGLPGSWPLYAVDL